MLQSVGRRIPLWLVVALSGLGYWLLYVWFPLLPFVDRVPPADIRTFLPTLQGGMRYALLLAGLYGLYVLAFWRFWAGPRDRSQAKDGPPKAGPRDSLAVILLIAALLAAPLLLVYSVNSTDVYRYVISGRISTVYGASPFETTRDAFPNDPYVSLAGEWARETTPYGPVWEGVAAGVTALSRGDLTTNIILFKFTGLLLHLGCAGLIWAMLARQKLWHRSAYTMLWAWNPALLLTFVMGAHNDVLMLFWLLLGVWLLSRGANVSGMWVMMLAVLTKPVAALVLPLFLLAVMRDLPSWRERLQYGVAVGVGAVVLGWLSFWPWSGPDSAFMTPFRLGARLVREATTSAGFSVSVASWFRLTAWGVDIPLDTLGLVLRGLFLVLLVWLLWGCWRGRSPLWGTATVFLGYLYQALSFRIWYATWPFAFLLLDATRPQPSVRAAYRLHVGLWFLLLSQLSVIVYGHIRVWRLDGEQPTTHYYGVLLVFVLPWVLAALSKAVVDELAARPSPQALQLGRRRSRLPGSR